MQQVIPPAPPFDPHNRCLLPSSFLFAVPSTALLELACLFNLGRLNAGHAAGHDWRAIRLDEGVQPGKSLKVKGARKAMINGRGRVNTH